MQSLVESLPDLAREQGAVTAVRDRSGPSWRFLSWSELYGEVNRIVGAWAERVERGQRLVWTAPPGTRRICMDLALLHLGVVGAQDAPAGPAAEVIDVSTYDRLVETREQAGRLVRLVTELRARDLAVEFRGGRLSQQGVLELARRVATAVHLGPPDPVLVSATGPAEQSCAWGALVGGYGVVVGGPELLAALSPKVWVCTTDQLRGLGKGAAETGRLRGGLRRVLGRNDPVLGDHLARVFVDGAVPAEAQSLRDRGVEVHPWPA